MDIAKLSMNLSMIETNTQVGTAMLSKALDTSEALGAGMVEMLDAAAMERSVTPNLGANFDQYI